jgi:hypothetical protein
MSSSNHPLTARRRRQGYAGLPRGKICIRAVHHVFHPACEKEDGEDGVGWIRVRLTTAEK